MLPFHDAIEVSGEINQVGIDGLFFHSPMVKSLLSGPGVCGNGGMCDDFFVLSLPMRKGGCLSGGQ